MNKQWNPAPVVPGLEIGVHDDCGKCVYNLDDSTWFAYVQHDCLHSSPTHQKLMMRDGGWRGAMKAIITNFQHEAKKEPADRKQVTKLIVQRISRSGKSLVVKAEFGEER